MFKLFKEKPMKRLQKKIDRGESALALINEIEQMDTYKNPLESINTLFSITESLLKEILHNNKPCGKNITLYHSKNSNTIINLQQIQKAIAIRHETTHALLVRDVIKTDFAIDTYLKYIRIIAYENKLDLNTFVPLSSADLGNSKPRALGKIKKSMAVTALGLSLFVLSFFYFNQTLNPKLLTGSTTGTYYPIANGIKAIISPNITVLESQGSMDNMKHLGASRSEEVLFAFVQNDVLKYLSKEALSGDVEKQTMLNKTKVLMPLYNGEIHVLVRENNKEIKYFKDLKGKKISIGMKDSGTAITAKSLYFNLFHEEINKVYQPFSEALTALKDRSVDAIVLTGGQPLSKLNKNMNQLRLISYEGEPLNGYGIGYIQKSSYPWLKEEKIRTLTVQSLIVTNIDSSKEKLLYLKEFLAKLKEYKIYLRNNNEVNTTHPKLKKLAQHRCLSPLPIGLEYHPLVKWNTPWCKKD